MASFSKSRIWAIGDLHLAISVPEKKMDVFGDAWHNYMEKISFHWKEKIQEGDLVLVPGDITWAMHLDEAEIDLKWIDRLPGTKVLIRGNHDYWWNSLSKLKKILPSSIHLIHNDSFMWNNIAIAGTRLWDTPEYNFDKIIPFIENPRAKKIMAPEDPQEVDKIFTRELGRLELSLKAMDPTAAYRIVMTHYPPIGANLAPSRTSELLERYKIDVCVFGHLHNVDPSLSLFGELNKVKYILTSADYLRFNPIEILL